MHAVRIMAPGGPDVLQWAEAPDPVCGPGEVVIEVAASAVNRADLLQRQGFYPPPPDAAPWPGLECSGTVAEVGADVRDWNVGDEVCALLSGGGYAERVAVPAGQVLPVPAGVDVVSAAALPEVLCTVWANVVQVARLRAGEVLLVHGGAGGIGTAAIQVGVALGATVAVTAGSAAKLERCAELGATVLVDYHQDDFVEVVRTATNGHGADVVLDGIGAKYLARNVDVLALDGRLLVIGLQGGRRAELDLNALMSKRATMFSATLRSRPVEQKAEIVAGVRRELWPLVESGVVRPIVDRVVAMRDARIAHELVERGDHMGKVLLRT